MVKGNLQVVKSQEHNTPDMTINLWLENYHENCQTLEPNVHSKGTIKDDDTGVLMRKDFFKDVCGKTINQTFSD